MKLRHVLLGSLALLLIPFVFGAILVISVFAQLPLPQGGRVAGPHGVVGVQAGGSFAWVVPAGEGVVLIDAGQDPTAAPLLEEIGDRPVLGILLTHAHVDHTGGLGALPEAPVVLLRAEQGLLSGAVQPAGWIPEWLARTSPKVELPADLTLVEDGQEVSLGGQRFLAVATPGHSAGSVSWLWKDVLFVGDAVLQGPQGVLMVPPAALSDDPALGERSLDQLLPLNFSVIADGHVGLRLDGRAALFEHLGRALEPPTVSLVELLEEGDPLRPRFGLPFKRQALYVQAPSPDRLGRRQASLLFDEGTSWVIADQPVAGHERFVDRRVSVEGRSVVDPASPRSPNTHVELSHIELAEGQEPSSSPAPPLVTARAPLAARVGRWVEAVGRVRSPAPLTRGARFGEAALQMGAEEVRLVGPMAMIRRTDAELTVLAEVRVEGDELVLVAHVVCAGRVSSCGVRP